MQGDDRLDSALKQAEAAFVIRLTELSDSITSRLESECAEQLEELRAMLEHHHSAEVAQLHQQLASQQQASAAGVMHKCVRFCDV